MDCSFLFRKGLCVSNCVGKLGHVRTTDGRCERRQNRFKRLGRCHAKTIDFDLTDGHVVPFYLRESPAAGQPQFMTIERPDMLELAQPLNQKLVQPVGRVQWNPVADVIDLLVAPGSFHEMSRHLHAFAVEVVIV
jgi:hypothetical protein